MFLLYLTFSYLSSIESINYKNQLDYEDNKLDDVMTKTVFSVFHNGNIAEFYMQKTDHFKSFIHTDSDTNGFAIINHHSRPIDIKDHKTIASYTNGDKFQIIFNTKLIIYEDKKSTHIIFPNNIQVYSNFLLGIYHKEISSKKISIKLRNYDKEIEYEDFNYLKLSGRLNIEITKNKITLNKEINNFFS